MVVHGRVEATLLYFRMNHALSHGRVRWCEVELGLGQMEDICLSESRLMSTGLQIACLLICFIVLFY
jgi:hypothetical protein